MIEAFAPPGTYRQVRHFTTPEGAPKSVWCHRETGALVLLGSLPLHWPEPERLEGLLPWLNGLGATGAGRTSLWLRHYHRSLAGRFVVRAARHRHFLASYAPQARCCLPSDGLVVARALAEFHQLGRQQMEREGAPMAREFLKDLVQNWLLLGLQAARPCTAPDLRPGLDAALCELSRWQPQRLEALDAMPHGLIHGDWQAKNLLLAQDSGSGACVHVLDSESCRWLPRLFDVYFLLSWDDLCSGQQRPELALARLRHYLDCSGGLTDQERQLLPDLLRLKAWSNAVWSGEGQRPWHQRCRARRAIFRNSMKMADLMRRLDTSIL